MKKLFYTLVVMFSMFSLNTMADSYWYLHYNYPDGDRDEVQDSMWVNKDMLNKRYYTDDTKAEVLNLNNFVFPTYEGYQFVGFFDEGMFDNDKKVFYLKTDTDEPFIVFQGYYVSRNINIDLFGRWEKVEDTTAINEIELTPQTNEIYTINGIKLQAITQSGLYIINGKKTYIK